MQRLLRFGDHFNNFGDHLLIYARVRLLHKFRLPVIFGDGLWELIYPGSI